MNFNTKALKNKDFFKRNKKNQLKNLLKMGVRPFGKVQKMKINDDKN